MNAIKVAILMGSVNDKEIMLHTSKVLTDLAIPHEMSIRSAHRTPKETAAYIQDALIRGAEVFVAAAGLAAHLAGFVAAHTVKPVIGVPLDASSLNGLDSLLSTVQMPAGVPVATVAIGSAGAKNAGFLAAQILSLQNNALVEKLIAVREADRAKIESQNATDFPH